MVDEPGREDIAELGNIARQRMPGDNFQITGGVIRLNGTDVTVAVVKSDEDPGMTFVWGGSLHSWRRRRDVDPDEAAGLIEWRRARHERSTEGSEFDGDFYDPA